MNFKIYTSTIADGNMSYKFGDKATVDANFRRFCEKNGINPHKIVYMGQAHGDRIGVVKRAQIRRRTDGLITNKHGLWLAVYHADCLPLFLLTDKTPGVPGTAIGVAHIGWRGAVAGLPAKMVREMVKHFKVDPKNLTVKFGPFICAKHYDVDASDERTKLLPTVDLGNERAGIDLLASVKKQLLTAGINHYQLTIDKLVCTAESPEKYWSYHRDRKNSGAMISFIGVI